VFNDKQLGNDKDAVTAPIAVKLAAVFGNTAGF